MSYTKRGVILLSIWRFNRMVLIIYRVMFTLSYRASSSLQR